jgi:hypothetical protein
MPRRRAEPDLHRFHPAAGMLENKKKFRSITGILSPEIAIPHG